MPDGLATGMLHRNMNDAPPPRVAALHRYPVKGLSAETLAAVDLVSGRGFPDDRRFAIALGTTAYDPTEPKWLPKSAFFQLARHERLAMLQSRYDSSTETLSLARSGKVVAHGKATDPQGRAVIGEFLSAFLAGEGQSRPKLVEGPGASLSDCGEAMVSIVGDASVADLARVVGRPLDRLRFRANIYVVGFRPWEELGWVGRELMIGGARLAVVERIGRCAATNVDLATGDRDVNLPRSLQQSFGHADMGVYARVIASGRIAGGDAVTF